MKENSTPSVKLWYQINGLLSSLVFASQGKNFMVVKKLGSSIDSACLFWAKMDLVYYSTSVIDD